MVGFSGSSALDWLHTAVSRYCSVSLLQCLATAVEVAALQSDWSDQVRICVAFSGHRIHTALALLYDFFLSASNGKMPRFLPQAELKQIHFWDSLQ